MEICAGCKQPIFEGEPTTNWIGYWSAVKLTCHLECLVLRAESVIEQQIIDADCNDCYFFKRGKVHKEPGLTWWDGVCNKFNRWAEAYPVRYSGYECFEHRKRHVEISDPTS